MRSSGCSDVYDLTVEGSHEFFAGGVLVHNCDEVGSWQRRDIWDEALLPAVRIGEHPHIVVTTTPKPTSLMKELVGRTDGSVRITKGSSRENEANLSAHALRALESRYGGTRLGKQELEGELLSDVDGALWLQDTIAMHRVDVAPLDLVRIVIGVDPAMTSGENADATGIVVAAKDSRGHAYVLDDRSMPRARPDEWARGVVKAYHDWQADRVLAETNNGGDMVILTLAMVDKMVTVQKVTATRGKLLRAEPVATAYERGLVHHVGEFRELEAEMTSWSPDPTLRGAGISRSPDRLDALVYAIAGLNISGGRNWQDIYLPQDMTDSTPAEVERARRGWGAMYDSVAHELTTGDAP